MPGHPRRRAGCEPEGSGPSAMAGLSAGAAERDL